MEPLRRGKKACQEILRKVHSTLKKKTKTMSSRKVWASYIKDEKQRKLYAEAMHELATVYWPQKEQNDPGSHRYHWITEKNEEYRETLVEIRKKERWTVMRHVPTTTHGSFSYPPVAPVIDPQPELKWLDVGSSYNPLSELNLDLLAIDIAPAEPSVKRCDLVDVKLLDRIEMQNGWITGLRRNNYDVVVCSLVLDFIPGKDLRLLCCKKIAELLKVEGMLYVVSPDTVKPNLAMDRMTESWRLALGLLGFSRLYFEKLGPFRCMGFRKVAVPPTIWEHVVLKELNAGEKVLEIQHLLTTPMDYN